MQKNVCKSNLKQSLQIYFFVQTNFRYIAILIGECTIKITHISNPRIEPALNYRNSSNTHKTTKNARFTLLWSNTKKNRHPIKITQIYRAHTMYIPGAMRFSITYLMTCTEIKSIQMFATTIYPNKFNESPIRAHYFFWHACVGVGGAQPQAEMCW